MRFSSSLSTTSRSVLSEIGRQHGGHVAFRIMRLEPRSLIGDQRVRGGMGFVEAVARERLHLIEDVIRARRLDTPLRRALQEYGALLRHLLRLLLAHRTPQQVGAAERIAGQDLRDLHDLLLIQDHAVGRLQRRFEPRMQVVGRRAGAMLARDELVGHLHRARAEQSNDSRQVVESVRLQALDEVAHAERLELEYRRRAALAQQLVRLGVVDGNRVDVQRRLAATRTLAIDRGNGLVDDRERL